MQRGRYAQQTQVSSDDTKLDIERTLRKYGADQFMSGWQNNAAIVGFRINERMFRIQVPLPDPDQDEFRLQGINQFGGVKERSTKSRDRLYEQAVRTRWRALLLVLKATLEAVDVGIFTLEEALVAHTLLPDGHTVAEWVEPQVDQVYTSGQMPRALPGFRPEPENAVGRRR